MNGVIMQFFHWYHEGNLWKEFIEKAEDLQKLGFTAVWFPPAVKSAGGKEGRGYDVYDLYDLGEFDQRGTVPTRYGTKTEYIEAIDFAHACGLQVYADIVLNHRIGADEKETVKVQQVCDENRNEKLGEPFFGEGYTKFTSPGRNGKYSDFIWDHQSFSGIDCILTENGIKKGIFKIHNDCGTEWNDKASHQFGNYDYLMGADVEVRNPYVVEELKKWIKWYIKTTKIDGLRLDALKHISSDFMKDWISYIKTEIDGDFFFVGEYWKDQVEPLSEFSEKMDNQLSLFDVPLHYNFFEASHKGSDYDLRTIVMGTVLQTNPVNSVSFVGNHDTQRLQSLESSVEDWFRPLAYAVILLSEKAYPCVFYPDLYGAEYVDKDKNGNDLRVVMPQVEILPKLLQARQKYAYGEQISYFDHRNCIAWIRRGKVGNDGCVVIISNGEESSKEIDLGKEFAGKKYRDFLNNRTDIIVLDDNGRGRFYVNSKAVSVWVQSEDYN